MESLHFSTEEKMIDIFGHPDSRSFDGIHPRGKHGSHLYNECIITAFENAGMTNRAGAGANPCQQYV